MSMVFLLLNYLFMMMFFNNPFTLMIVVLFLSVFFIMWMFLCSLNYWLSFMFFLSFLVGLFLLFMYFISFLSKTFFVSYSIKNMMTYFFIMLSSFFFFSFFFNNWNVSFYSYETFYWIYSSKNNIIMVISFWFIFMISLIFWLIKITKKNMKSSL